MKLEQVMQQVDERQRNDLLQWEEAVSYTFGQEVEVAYMQGVRDGAELVFTLLGQSGRSNEG